MGRLEETWFASLRSHVLRELLRIDDQPVTTAQRVQMGKLPNTLHFFSSHTLVHSIFPQDGFPELSAPMEEGRDGSERCINKLLLERIGPEYHADNCLNIASSPATDPEPTLSKLSPLSPVLSQSPILKRSCPLNLPKPKSPAHAPF